MTKSRPRSVNSLRVLLASAVLIAGSIGPEVEVFAAAQAPAVVDEGRQTAERALTLLIRTIETGMPREFPSQLRKGLGAHVEADFYEHRYYEDATRGYFEPDWIWWKNRKLARELTKFWKTPPSKLTQALPYVEKIYFEQGDFQVRRGLVRLMRKIHVLQGDGLLPPEVPWVDRIAEEVFIDFVEKSPHDEHRLEILPRLELLQLSDQSTRRILDLAQGRDLEKYDIRKRETSLLIGGAVGGQGGPEFLDYLTRVAWGDACQRCQMTVISSVLTTKYKERFVPICLAVLEREANGSIEVAEAVVSAVGIWGQLPEAVPALIRVLDAHDMNLRSRTITGLERTTGLDARTMGYATEDNTVWRARVIKERFDPADVEALESMVARWKEWWRIQGPAFLQKHGVNLHTTETPVVPAPGGP